MNEEGTTRPATAADYERLDELMATGKSVRRTGRPIMTMLYEALGLVPAEPETVTSDSTESGKS
jgi:hypothetical protein